MTPTPPVPQNPLQHLESILVTAIDAFVDHHLQSATPESDLFKGYRHFFKHLKAFAGTSSGFTGLLEVLFFRFILKDLEKRLGLKFQVTKASEETNYFQAAEIILTHDIDVDRFAHKGRAKPDVAIFRHRGLTYDLLAAFQIKIYINTKKNLETDLECLGRLGAASDAELYEVICSRSRQYCDRLSSFCQRFEHRAFVISHHPYGYNRTLRQAVDSIVSKITGPKGAQG
jgi:hypothetical protein